MGGIAKKWTLRDNSGDIRFVGCVSELSFYTGYDTTQIYSAIRNHFKLGGLSITEATPEEKQFVNSVGGDEPKLHIPSRYKDSHSVRFTPL